MTMAVVFFTGIWIITTILNVMTAGPGISIDDKIALVANPGLLYYSTYINAAIITILTVALYAGFYYYCREIDPLWSLIAFAFVPIYGFGNLVSYLSQILVLPDLAMLHSQGENLSHTRLWLSQLIQDWPGSAMARLNAVSYGILGIPSVIFAMIFIRKNKRLQMGGLFLALSGILSIIAVIGVAIKNEVLGFMLVISGVIYFAALIMMGIFWLRVQQT